MTPGTTGGGLVAGKDDLTVGNENALNVADGTVCAVYDLLCLVATSARSLGV